MRSCLVLAVFATAVFGLSSAPAQQPMADVHQGGFDVVFLGEPRPLLLRMNIEVNGKTHKTVWREYLKKWFDYLDRDNNGALDAKELQYAPRDQAMLQTIRQGNFFLPPPNQVNQPVVIADFNKDAKDKITFDDFASYYDRQRMATMQVSGGFGGQAYNPTGDTLFKLLDKNDDGKLSKEELTDAVKVLMKLDTDDDEYVSAAEIVPGNNAQGIGGLALQLGQPNPQPGPVSKSFYPVPAPAADAGLAILLLATYDRNKDKKLSRTESGLPKDIFDRLDTDKDGALDVEELSRWHQRGADFSFTVRLGKTDAAAVELAAQPEKKFAKAVTKAEGAQVIALGDAQIQIARGGGGNAGFALAFGRGNLLQIFQQLDTRKQGFLELKDLKENRQLQVLAQIFPMLDKDGDGKLTLKELREYVELQSGGADCLTNLTIAEHGRNLFKLLDANGDGKLSLREMKSAWSRLKHLDVDGDGSIDLTELTRQYQLAFDQGGQQNTRAVVALRGPMAAPAPRPNYPADTPLWFKKMDRNGDGDVSFREFLGTREEFDAIDTDRDGLISPAEAASYDEKMRQNKR